MVPREFLLTRKTEPYPLINLKIGVNVFNLFCMKFSSCLILFKFLYLVRKCRFMHMLHKYVLLVLNTFTPLLLMVFSGAYKISATVITIIETSVTEASATIETAATK